MDVLNTRGLLLEAGIGAAAVALIEDSEADPEDILDLLKGTVTRAANKAMVILADVDENQIYQSNRRAYGRA